MAGRCPQRHRVPRPVHVLRLVRARHEPPRARPRPRLPRRAVDGRAHQAQQLRRLHGRDGAVRRHVRPRARRRRPAAPVLRRGRRARRRERSQGRVRLEVALERGARPRPRPRHPRAAPARGVPRPERVHDVADEHRSRQDRPLPDVRLAADRQPLRPRRDPGRGAAGTGAGRARAGEGGLRRAPARHRLRDRRAHPGRGRRPPLPPRVPAGAAAALPCATTRCSSSTRCRRAAG